MMAAITYAEPLLAARRALHRASELAAEGRYIEARAHLAALRLYATQTAQAMVVAEQRRAKLEGVV
jgi:hypothetical protein